jgi:hypothetical protein
MTLIETIKKAQIQARKEKNEISASTLTTLIGEAEMIGKNDGNRQSTDAEVTAVIKKFIKNIDETVTVLEKAAQPDVARLEKLAKEKVILTAFMPKQLTELELRDIVGSILITFEEKNPKLMGKVLGILKEKYAGQYDGALSSKIVKEMLA